MFTARIQANELPERLDAEYFTPEFVAADARIGDASRRGGCLKSLDQLRAPAAGLCYGVLQPRFVEHGVPAIEIGDLATGVLLPSELRISKEQHDEYRRSAVIGGDVLISVKGTLGVTAIASEGIEESNVNRDIARLRVRRPEIDPYYLVVFLRSLHGGLSLQRIVRGTIQRNLNIGDLLEHPVLVPDALAQRYIGDKVRQAERLRERARKLEAGFRSAVAVTIPSRSSRAGKTSRVQTGELERNLNPGAYTPDRRAVRAALRGAGGRSLDTLADVESPTTDSYLDAAPYLGLNAIDSATCGLKPSTAAAEAVTGTARLLREGPALSRLRPYLNKATYIPPTLAGGIGSTELLLVRPKAGVDGWFLYGVLKLESSVRQLNPVATGSTHPRVDREDVLDLLVPWRDEHEALGAKLRTAQACYFASAVLTAAAMILVEQLIDGHITEGDLITAQKALDGETRSADREILTALWQSDALDAKPLIGGVDALYVLLAESEDEDA